MWKRLKCVPFNDLCNLPDDHTYNVLSPEETAQYYLAGYVAFKVNRTADCADCKKDLVGSQDALLAEALLIIERAHVSGCLVYPSRKLFACISTIEKTVSQASEPATFGDLFWKVLDSLIENGTNTVGCSQHCSEFTGKVIHFYLVTRRHFSARKKCQATSVRRVHAKSDHVLLVLPCLVFREDAAARQKVQISDPSAGLQ